MTSIFRFTLSSLVALSIFAITACDTKKRKKDDEPAPKIPVVAPEQKAVGQNLMSAKIYKGSWRPVVDCKANNKPNLTLTFDLWEKTATLRELEANKREPSVKVTLTDERLRGKTLGTTRDWEADGGFWEIPGSEHARLVLDIHGKGYAYWQKIYNPMHTCKWCKGQVTEFTCTERPIAFEHNFVHEACKGNLAFVESFLKQNPNVADYVNQVGVIGETALTCALKNGHSSIVELLLNLPKEQSGLDMKAGNIDGESPLLVDLNRSGAYAKEFMKRADVDINLVDNHHRSFLSTPHFTVAMYQDLVMNKKMNADLLSLKILDLNASLLTTLQTNGLGAFLSRNWNLVSIQSILAMTRTLQKIDYSAAAIEGRSFLEHAIFTESTFTESAQIAKYLLEEAPGQKIAMATYAGRLLLMSSKTCDADFIGLVMARGDFDGSAKDSAGNNAIDLVRGTNCPSQDTLIEKLEARGVIDRSNPVVPACRGDLAAYEAALKIRGPMMNRTAKLFECIWDKPNFLAVFARYTDLQWNWPVIEAYAFRAIDFAKQDLMNFYLLQLRWPTSSTFIGKLKQAMVQGKVTAAIYLDTLFAQNAVSEENFKVGAWGHLAFDLIEAEDTTRLEKYFRSTSYRSWPTLDITKNPESLSHYSKVYNTLLSSAVCTLPTENLPESTYLFALRRGKMTSAELIAKETLRANAAVAPVSIRCAEGQNVYLFNPLSFAIRSCSAETMSGAYLQNQFEGLSRHNRLVRRSVWDTLVQSSDCTTEQVTKMTETLVRKLNPQDEREIFTAGTHYAAVAAVLKNAGYVLRPVVTGFIGENETYPAMGVLKNYNESIFARADGQVFGGAQTFLSGTGPKLSDLQAQVSYIVSFAGLRDHARLSVSQSLKKGSCLFLQAEGELLMANSSLPIKSVTVCQNSLRFQFDPTTSEKTLPIKNHVDGAFEFSIDGLEEATTTPTP